VPKNARHRTQRVMRQPTLGQTLPRLHAHFCSSQGNLGSSKSRLRFSRGTGGPCAGGGENGGGHAMSSGDMSATAASNPFVSKAALTCTKQSTLLKKRYDAKSQRVTVGCTWSVGTPLCNCFKYGRYATRSLMRGASAGGLSPSLREASFS